MRVSLSRKTQVEPEYSKRRSSANYFRGISWLGDYRNDLPNFTGNVSALPNRQLPCGP